MARINAILKLSFVILFLVPSLVSASEVVLKSGEKIEGKILEQTNKYVKIDAGLGVAVTYYNDEINTLDGEVIHVQAPPKAVVAAPVVQQTQELALPPRPVVEPVVPPRVPTAPVIVPSKASSVEAAQNVPSPAPRAYAQSVPTPPTGMTRYGARKDNFAAMAVLAGMGGFGIAIIIISIFAFWIFPTYCLQRISERTNRGVPWMAWVPIANLFLMCKIAGIRYTWLWCILLAFIPILGVLCVWALCIFIWYKIALALNKPGWWGALTVVPILGIVALGYLTLSE